MRVGARVLIIEHQKPVAATLRKFLEAAGWAVDTAEPPGVDAVDAEAHEVVVVGAADGGEAATRQLKQFVPGVPVILVYGPEQEDADARAAQVGADGILVGPLRKPAVVGCVAAMARVRALLREIADLEHRLEANAARVTDGFDEPPAAPAGKQSAKIAGAYDFELYQKLLLMEVRRSKRYKYPISVAMVAIDRWPELAQSLDSRSRQGMLGELLAIIKTAIRDIDLPLLYAEEKFLIFMPHTGAQGAAIVGQRLCDEVRAFEGDVNVTTSVGVSGYEGTGAISFGGMIQGATDAVHKAQIGGGNRCEVAAPNMAAEAPAPTPHP